MPLDQQPQTFLDLYTGLMNRARAFTGRTVTDNIAKQFINTGLIDMHVGTGERFPWAHDDAILITHPQYSTGTLTATKGSAAIVGVNTDWDTVNDLGQKNMRVNGTIRIASNAESIRISAVASDLAATLDHIWIGETISGASYIYQEDEYDLAANFLRPLDIQNFDVDSDIRIIHRSEFRQRYGRNAVAAKTS